MAKIYDEKVSELHDLLRDASSENGATVLIPNLQRPYVWTPTQVILLIDSLIRGWPFGTLLLWKVHHSDLATIPSRTFWKVVDRTDENCGAQVSRQNPPGEFRMVLDGQQRLQSLLIALGGDDWGFRLEDREWIRETTGELPKGRTAAKHWSLAHLTFDLVEFLRLSMEKRDLLKIDFRDVLVWAVHDTTSGHSKSSRPATYKFPTPCSFDPAAKGRYVRLSRLWQLAGNNPQLKESYYKEKLRPVLAEHQVTTDVLDALLTPLAELMTTLRDVKLIKVAYLEVARFDPQVWEPDVYNEAIVNIFTRLNTAGRTLTREEITFAWIKTGWNPSLTGSNEAGACFEKLQSELKTDRVDLQMDELVGAVSMIWAVLSNKGHLLTDRDLLQGDKVRPMAKDLCGNWAVIVDSLTLGSSCLEELGIVYGMMFNSINSLSLVWAWIVLAEQWASSVKLTVVSRDEFDKLLGELINQFADRWILLSQWAGRWGMSTGRILATYAQGLAEDWEIILKKQNSEDVLEVLEVLQLRMEKWLSDLRPDAAAFIQSLNVDERTSVRQYFVPLWVWHRLDKLRFEYSRTALRHDPKKKSVKAEVDHVVAVKIWEDKLVDPTAKIDISDEDIGQINHLGNCILLDKSFNLSKGKSSLGSFLAAVHEFKSGKVTLGDWANSMRLNGVLLEPAAFNCVALKEAIQNRGKLIRQELLEYVHGTRQRTDKQ